MIAGKPFHPIRQRGAALIITLMISVLLSLLGMYGAGILVLDTRSAANDFRAREAMAAAESGTEQGLSILNANRARISASGLHGSDDLATATVLSWTTCTSTASPCLSVRSDDRTNWKYLDITGLTRQPVAEGFKLFLLTHSSGPSSPLKCPDPLVVCTQTPMVYNIVAIGKSADGTSNATVKQGAYFYQLLRGNVGAPIAASNVDFSGNFSIITDSNGGGTGVPVSAWSGSPFPTPPSPDLPGGSFASCHKGVFELNGGTACPSSAAALSKSGSPPGPDLVVNNPGFPTDLFQFLFGVPAADFQVIMDQAKVVTDCGGLAAASSGLIWVTGNCDPRGNIGTAASPVLLVVQGDTSIKAGSHFYGLLYMFKTGGTSNLIGNAHLHGAVFAHSGVSLKLNGGFVLELDSKVLENLKNSPSARGLARIPGAWSDVQ